MYLIKQKELTKSVHSPEKENVELFARFETRFLYQWTGQFSIRIQLDAMIQLFKTIIHF